MIWSLNSLSALLRRRKPKHQVFQKIIWMRYLQLMNKLTMILVFITVFGCGQTLAQNKSSSQKTAYVANKALFGALGLGYLDDDAEIFATGISWGIGYQQDMRSRLRLVSSLTYGTYSNRGAQDVSDAYVNSLNLKFNINLDVIKINSFALFIGTGIGGNYTSGLVESNYHNRLNFLLNGLVGFRLNPISKRIGYELVLFNGSGSLNKRPYMKYFVEVVMFQARIIFKMNGLSN